MFDKARSTLALATLTAAALALGCAASRAPASGTAAAAPVTAPAAATVPAPAPAPPRASAVEQVLLPAELDPAADKYLAPQFAFLDARAPRAPHLVVYLVGANGKPAGARAMARFLAGLGFLVVVPGYANDYNIRALCASGDAPDLDCHGKLRREALEGTDQSPHIEVSRANSLEARVARMLAELARRQPEIGWDRYLGGDQPRWGQIIVAGHSHGASASALIAKVREVHRVVMLSGPFDNRGGEPAAWTRGPSATPADRYFGFSHTQEEQHAGHLKDWGALGLGAFGPTVVVETSAPPFATSHQLVTALAPAGGTNYHGTTAAGGATPREAAEGPYRFEPTWRYLFGL